MEDSTNHENPVLSPHYEWSIKSLRMRRITVTLAEFGGTLSQYYAFGKQ